MSLQITRVNTPAHLYAVKCPYKMDPAGVTIHETGNIATAMSEISYMLGNNREVSYQFAVDDERAVQGLPLDRNGWHAGDGGNGFGNRSTIGVEHCFNWTGGKTTKGHPIYDARYHKAIANGVELVAQLFMQYPKWGAPEAGKNMWRHYDHSRKNCPQRMIEEGKWLDYVNRVKKRYLELKGIKAPTVPKVETAKSYTVLVTLNGYVNAEDAKAKKNAKTKISPGSYTIFKEASGMINVTKKAGVAGSWINPSDNKAPAVASKSSLKSLDVIAKEVLDGKWGNNPERTKKLTSAGYDAKEVQSKVNALAKPSAKKTYVQLAAHEPLWRAYRLGATPVEGNEVGFLAPHQYGGLEYQILGYEDGGTCAIIQTQAFGKVKIFIKDPSAKIVNK